MNTNTININLIIKMTKIYNQNSQIEKRRKLRQYITKTEKIIWDKIRNRQIEDCKFRR